MNWDIRQKYIQYLKSLSKEKIKFCIFSPNFFLKRKKKKKKKTCYEERNKILSNMWGKIKLVLRKRGLELLRQKSSRPTCVFCHPHKILAERFLKTNKRRYGDKTNMAPRMQSICKDMTRREQCNASKPDML
jgi:hypothetical protein